MIRVFVSRGTSLFGRAIRWFTNADVNHAGFVVRMGDLRPHVLALPALPGAEFFDPAIGDEELVRVEADSPGVIATRRYQGGALLLDYPIDEGDQQKLLAFVARQLGKGYDFYSILGFPLRRTVEERKASGRWFCSELVSAACAETQIPLFHTSEHQKITPRDVAITPVLFPAAA